MTWITTTAFPPAPAALAIQPSQWVHTTEADFATGTTENTVTTNLGDVKLATKTEVIGQIPQQASVIYDLQVTDNGDLYLAVGPEAAVLRRRGDQIEEVLRLPDGEIFSLGLTPQGDLLVGVSSPTASRIAVLDGDQLRTVVELEAARYIWDILTDGSSLYVATGTDGKLLEIDLEGVDPVVTERLDAQQNNLLCLARDRHGRICVGTDTDGLIYRVTVQDDGQVDTFVLYDAPEPEIGTLLITEEGVLFAGTADAQQAKPGRLTESTQESGRPDTLEPGDEKAEPGDLPQIPPKPQPQDHPPAPATEPAQTHAPPTPSSSMGTPYGRPSNQPAERQTRGPTSDSWQPSSHTSPIGGDPAGYGDGRNGSETDPSDALRRLIHHKIEEATRSGSWRPAALNSGGTKLNRSTRARRGYAGGAGSSSEQPSKDGNAIYRIDPEGFVTEVFRESVMILKLIEAPNASGQLLVATGNEGQIYRVDPASEETIILADLDPEQVPAMLADRDGQVLLGTANPAMLYSMAAGYAREGTYTSPVLDARQISLWGKLYVTGTIPAATTIAVESRSGNVEDPDQAAWSAWSGPQALEHDPGIEPTTPRPIDLVCPPARFLQYRLSFAGDGGSTAVVDQIAMKYVVPNLKPIVTSITAKYPEATSRGSSPDDGNGRQPVLNVKWEASDPNDDRLRCRLEYQQAGFEPWRVLAEDLDDQKYDWDTRHVPDGWYIVRVTADDSPDNASDMIKSVTRRSDPILIDNTPPDLGALGRRVEGTEVWIASQVRDALSPIRAISYSLDSNDWKPVLPDDLIFDSTQETFTIKLNRLTQGPHAVTVRATDDSGNTRYQAVSIEIP